MNWKWVLTMALAGVALLAAGFGLTFGPGPACLAGGAGMAMVVLGCALYLSSVGFDRAEDERRKRIDQIFARDDA